jgi:polygalacturonase
MCAHTPTFHALGVQSGIDYFGRLFGRPSANVMFRRNVIGTGHGITVGSETSGGVSNVTFEDIVMVNTGTGVRMKSQRGRGGVVQDVTYRRVRSWPPRIAVFAKRRRRAM